MYALWGADGLLDPGLGLDLAAVGADRLVVESDDEHVAEAQLRLSTYDDPVHAIVSVWTEGDPAAVTGLGPGHVSWPAGGRGASRAPAHLAEADGPTRWSTSRCCASRGMTREAWKQRWLEHHTQVAIDTQATSGYVQNIVIEPLREGQATVDALVEEFFPMAATTDMHAFYGSGGDDVELDPADDADAGERRRIRCAREHRRGADQQVRVHAQGLARVDVWREATRCDRTPPVDGDPDERLALAPHRVAVLVPVGVLPRDAAEVLHQRLQPPPACR